MRKFEVNVHYDVIMPATIEAVNEEDALNQARDLELDFSKDIDIFDGESCVTDVHENPEDYGDTVDALVCECIDKDHGAYSVDELEEAAKKVVRFDDSFFEQYTKDDLIEQILSIARKNAKNK